MLFRINKDEELNEEMLGRLISKFSMNARPILSNYKKYFDGQQNILLKHYSDASKPICRVVTNYCDYITKSYQGYITGKPITYNSKNDISQILDVLNYNDKASADNNFLEDALIYGVAYELQWVDELGKERFSLVNPEMSFPIYDNSLESDLLAFVRMTPINQWNDKNEYIVDVYDSKTIKTYKMAGIGGALTFIGVTEHHYGQVPISVFNLNRDNKSIFDKVISLQDAYNELLSSEIDDWSAFVDAYMVLTGIEADENDLKQMKENRVILLPPNDASAQYLTKNSNDTQINNMLSAINDNIHKISASPDFNSDKFMAQSGIAMRFKMQNFENSATNIIANFTKALQKRLELISAILNLKYEEVVWRDTDIIFSRNLPEDMSEIITLVNGLTGIVSEKTLLSQIPFISDVDEEMELVQKDKEKNYSLYSYGGDINE